MAQGKQRFGVAVHDVIKPVLGGKKSLGVVVYSAARGQVLCSGVIKRLHIAACAESFVTFAGDDYSDHLVAPCPVQHLRCHGFYRG